MKKLLLLFILTPILSVAQVDTDAYKVKSPYSTEKKTTEVKQEVNISNEKSAAELRIERAKAMAEPSTEVTVPLEVDLNNYTHIAIVHRSPICCTTKRLKEMLLNSPLSIIDPKEYDKKAYRKNKRFLRDIKDPNWIYLYLTVVSGAINTEKTVTVRDSKNKIIYNSKSINKTYQDVLSPLINF